MGLLQDLSEKIKAHPEQADQLLDEFLSKTHHDQTVGLAVVQLDTIRRVLLNAVQDLPDDKEAQLLAARAQGSLQVTHHAFLALQERLKQLSER